ncbi:peptidase M24 [Armillaria luteobubalina]|uniref:Peptidase M24 n=1 Tax=Armillaria luteobubalina TaxID=153913 RepID=A0AA39QAD7_9AGAR|nr:peptidase M24 [Armillaria luteobubalina]
MYATVRRNAQALATTIAAGSQTLSRPLIQKPSLYGQPLHPSHPHLVQPNELTAGIPHEEYERRRRVLMESLPDNSMVVAAAAPVTFMSGEIFHKYRQNSDFWYLTGFEEPDSAVILEKNSTSRGYSMTLFVNEKDPSEEKWSGTRTGVRAAGEAFHADDAQPIASFPKHLGSIASSYSHIFSDPQPHEDDPAHKKLLKYLSNPLKKRAREIDTTMSTISGSRRRPLKSKVAPFRAIKSEAERRVMRAAADISGRAHAKTMRFTHPGMSEAALCAHFEYLCCLDGAQRLAYVPVVASGPNALIIHYTSNNMPVQNDELLLIDAGCEYNGYASDITRTYPANGTFTKPQRDLYAAVLSAQKALVALCHESAGETLSSLHATSCRLLRAELAQISFNVSTSDLARELYPHSLSHPIGIDLHESHTISRAAHLQEGMVITIEPGIYIPPLPQYPKAFHNIGIRIEDEVLVGKTDPIVLTVSAPKEIVDVEGACQGLLGLEPY